jgi:hypothetical protein
LIAGTGVTPDSQVTYDEVAAKASEYRFEKGWDLMRPFIH